MTRTELFVAGQAKTQCRQIRAGCHIPTVPWKRKERLKPRWQPEKELVSGKRFYTILTMYQTHLQDRFNLDKNWSIDGTSPWPRVLSYAYFLHPILLKSKLHVSTPTVCSGAASYLYWVLFTIWPHWLNLPLPFTVIYLFNWCIEDGWLRTTC